jgi:hypothetical protein
MTTEGVGPDTAQGSTTGEWDMEANLLAAEPSALALPERKHDHDERQPEAEARENGGKEADFERAKRGGFPIRAATIAILAVGLVQVLWAALLAYGAYTAVEWLS